MQYFVKPIEIRSTKRQDLYTENLGYWPFVPPSVEQKSQHWLTNMHGCGCMRLVASIHHDYRLHDTWCQAGKLQAPRGKTCIPRIARLLTVVPPSVEQQKVAALAHRHAWKWLHAPCDPWRTYTTTITGYMTPSVRRRNYKHQEARLAY